MLSKVVAKKKDGALTKGLTGDFLPNKNSFHVNISPDVIVKVSVDELKAIFFVKSLEGNIISHAKANNTEDLQQHTIGKRIRVIFQDSEIIEGFSHSMHMDRLGFFMIPSDTESNNERIFVVFSFVKNIFVDGRAISLPSGKKDLRLCRICGNKMEDKWVYCPFDSTKI